MGVLKIVIDYSDQLLTYLIMLFLADMAFQFASTVTFDAAILEKDLMESVTSFRPDLSKYMIGYKVMKKVSNYLLSL
jgi:hypothetical protein